MQGLKTEIVYYPSTLRTLMLEMRQEEAPASDRSLPIIPAKYHPNYIGLSILDEITSTDRPDQELFMSHWSTRPLCCMIIAGTRWAVKTKACILHQRMTALLPPSLPLSNELWLAVWRGTNSIDYMSSPIFGRCWAAQHLSRSSEAMSASLRTSTWSRDAVFRLRPQKHSCGIVWRI